MRKTFSFYHRVTGAVHPHRFSTGFAENPRERQFQQHLAANTPADHVAIEGVLDREAQRMDLSGETPAVVDYQPPQPSDEHEWNADVKRWQLLPEVAQRQEQRRAALVAIRQIEESQPRAVREALLGQAGAVDRLRSLDERIATLRAQLG